MTVVSGPPLPQQAAIDSLRTWKYQPGYLNEKPLSTKPLDFRLCCREHLPSLESWLPAGSPGAIAVQA
jgi:hypothetical protein